MQQLVRAPSVVGCAQLGSAAAMSGQPWRSMCSSPRSYDDVDEPGGRIAVGAVAPSSSFAITSVLARQSVPRRPGWNHHSTHLSGARRQACPGKSSSASARSTLVTRPLVISALGMSCKSSRTPRRADDFEEVTPAPKAVTVFEAAEEEGGRRGSGGGGGGRWRSQRNQGGGGCGKSSSRISMIATQSRCQTVLRVEEFNW